MSSVMVLEWQFSPEDYFEEIINVARDDYTMTIGRGQVQTQIDSFIYQQNPKMRQELHDSLNSRFMGVQLLTHRGYQLSDSRIKVVHADGRKEFVMNLEAGRIEFRGGMIDFRIRDKSGNVVKDSRQERIERKQTLAELVASLTPTDSLLTSLLKSYAAAVQDPTNELVHLYEIRDALSTKFGGDRAARKILAISKNQWRRFGQLCNEEPLRQGRHRGKSSSPLRDATNSELAEARATAVSMIEAYLHHLTGSP